MRFGRAGYRRIDLKRARKKPTFSAATSLPRTRVSMIAEVPFFPRSGHDRVLLPTREHEHHRPDQVVIAGRKRMPAGVAEPRNLMALFLLKLARAQRELQILRI